jgi:hypothetical protein
MRWDSVFRIERMLESIDRLVCVRLDGTYNIDRPSGAVASSCKTHIIMMIRAHLNGVLFSYLSMHNELPVTGHLYFQNSS